MIPTFPLFIYTSSNNFLRCCLCPIFPQTYSVRMWSYLLFCENALPGISFKSSFGLNGEFRQTEGSNNEKQMLHKNCKYNCKWPPWNDYPTLFDVFFIAWFHHFTEKNRDKRGSHGIKFGTLAFHHHGPEHGYEGAGEFPTEGGGETDDPDWPRAAVQEGSYVRPRPQWVIVC